MDLNTIISLVGVAGLVLWKSGLLSKWFTHTPDPLGGVRAVAEVIADVKKAEETHLKPTMTIFDQLVTYKAFLDKQQKDFNDSLSKLKELLK